MGYTQDLLSWWDLSDINPVDLGFRGLGNHGVGTGLVVATDIVNGIHANSKAIEFNGINEYVDAADHASLNFIAGRDFSFGCWFRWITDNSDTEQSIMSKRSVLVAPFQGYEIYGTPGGMLTAQVTDDVPQTAVASSPGTYDDNAWHHTLAVFVSGVSLTLYIDGVQVAQDVTAVPSSDLTNTLPLRFGAPADYSAWGFPGAVDEPMIFGAALTGIQVADLHERTRQGRF